MKTLNISNSVLAINISTQHSNSDKNWGSWLCEKIQKIWRAFCNFICCKFNSESKTLSSQSQALQKKVALTQVSSIKKEELQPPTVPSSIRTTVMAQPQPLKRKIDSTFPIPGNVAQYSTTADLPASSLPLPPEKRDKKEENPPSKKQVDPESFIACKKRNHKIPLEISSPRQRPEIAADYALYQQQEALLNSIKGSQEETVNQNVPFVKMEKNCFQQILSHLKPKDSIPLLSTCKAFYSKRDKVLIKSVEKSKKLNSWTRTFPFPIDEQVKPKISLQDEYGRFPDELRQSMPLIHLIQTGLLSLTDTLHAEVQSFITEEQLVAVLEKIGKNLKTVILYKSSLITPRTVDTIAKYCPNLTTLAIHAENLSEEQLFSIAKGCKKITQFEFIEGSFTKEGMQTLGNLLPEVDYINLIDCPLNDETLIQIGKSFPRLRTLHFPYSFISLNALKEFYQFAFQLTDLSINSKPNGQISLSDFTEANFPRLVRAAAHNYDSSIDIVFRSAQSRLR
jgi:hypothetical protein